ncbi:MAG: transporter substrate-binding domain-containing protein [Gemmatimonadota bacterium]|jgi:ABC-type amino acid transport substrate-binding protein
MALHTLPRALVASLLVLTGASTAAAQRVDSLQALPDSGAVLRVAALEAPPFLVQEMDGWSGISLTLMDAIQEATGLELRIEPREDLGQLLADVEDGRVDMGAAALTVTSEREARLDFTQPFYMTGLAIAVRDQGDGTAWGRVAAQFVSVDFLKVILVWGAVLLVVGFLVWVFEHRPNPEFSEESAFRGILEGFWFSAVTMTTVGYGDKAPRTLGGRVVSLLWMFAALVGISSFTAAIASALTLGGLQGDIQGPEDLVGHRVGTVAASTSERYLLDRDIEPVRDASAARLLELLEVGEVDAVVYDAPILQYLIRENDHRSLQVLPGTFEDQYYAFALPQGSPHRETLNRAILGFVSTSPWRRTLTRYLGP